MKLIFLSLTIFIYGYFCDICIKTCEKMADAAIAKGKSLTGNRIVFMSKIANKSLLNWQRLEKRFLIFLL